jgi:hypothetical protein
VTQFVGRLALQVLPDRQAGGEEEDSNSINLKSLSPTRCRVAPAADERARERKSKAG